ncbi:alpha/beta hydrolase-fold protein [Plantibacter sp. YIM 135347]|uniref:alpha/beta hydrolase n=1 Tax=Plantibacter sp. YIM 135347 TaxID=3423919 RepID=UPI003D344981
MVNWILGLRIDRPEFVNVLAIIAAAVLVLLLVRGGGLRRVLIPLAAGIVGLGLGFGLAWLLGDQLNVFGIELTPTTRWWAALAFAGVFIALASLRKARAWRKVVAIVAVPLIVIVGAAGVNQDFGEFRTVRDALGISPYGQYDASTHAQTSTTLADWTAPADMPADGIVERVDIPSTTSGFAHRPALVYLPPAARTSNPPKLPVLEMFSGQPGQPSDLFQSGQIDAVLNAYARAHGGVAPIVVVPDQLGAPDRNPMCVDGPLGNAASYLTVDVPNWIRENLPVATDRSQWFVGGFSEGGTCAIQFGSAHSDLYGGILDISGEVVPTIGTDTVAKGFGGSQAAYAAAAPIAIMQSKAPYEDTVAIFGVGQDDQRYGPRIHEMADAAKAAGMRTTTLVSPGTAHDWHTVHRVFTDALPLMAARMGLDS